MGAKRQLTEEQLEKLKLARQKAMEVRQSKAQKMNEIKRLEKEAQEKELNDKLESVKKRVQPQVEQQEEVAKSDFVSQEPSIMHSKPKATAKQPKKSKAEIIRNVIEEESDDSESESDDEEESVVNPVKTFLKEKYKQKYKQKYESKHLTNLVKHSAHNHLKSRIDEEVFRLAQQAMFS